MQQGFINNIFNKISEGEILVFPTEVIRKSFLKAYAKEYRDRAVFADSLISFDTFKSLFKIFPQGKKKAEMIHRALFAETFFKTENANKLTYFSNSSFSDSESSFKKNIMKNLLYLKRARELGPEVESKSDINLLYDSYTAFLEENGLYEDDFIDLSGSVKDSDKYILVFPSTIEDLFAEDKEIEDLEIIDTQEETELNILDEYVNSLAEIRSRVRTIFTLLKNGIKCSDIVITLNKMDDYLPFLISECEKRNIPLNVQQGKKLSDYAAGRLFKDIKTLYSSDFHFDNLKIVLLNVNYSFKNKELINKVIRFAIDNKIEKSFKIWQKKLNIALNLVQYNELNSFSDTDSLKDDSEENGSERSELGVLLKKYRKKDIININSFIAKFYKSIELLCTSNNAVDFTELLYSFFDSFFEKEILDCSLEEEKALESSLSVLNNVKNVLNDSKVKKIDSFINFYLTVLSETSYTPNTGKEGIYVYSYPVSRGMNVPYHFVLGLSDADVQKNRKDVSFGVHIDSNGASITNAVLRAYACKTDNTVFLSYSKNTFGSANIAPSLFVEKNLVREIISSAEDDYFKKEEDFLFKTESSLAQNSNDCGLNEIPKFLNNQAVWFNSSFQKLLKAKEENTYESFVFPFKITATNFSYYQDCAYKWYCSDKYKNCNLEFDITMTDYRFIGTVLHKIFEKFYKTVKNYDDMFSHKEKLADIFEDELKKTENSLDSTDSLHLMELSLIKDDYTDINTDEDALVGFKTFGTEKKFILQREKYILEGRVDCILKNETGNFAVIDFKRTSNSVSKNSYQLVIYSELLEEGMCVSSDFPNDEYKKIPVFAKFYLFNDKKFKIYDKKEDMSHFYMGWPKDKKNTNSGEEIYQERKKELKELIDNLVETVEKKDFSPVPRKGACDKCNYSQLCRRGYVVK